MDLNRLLIASYPRAWRERYGPELGAMLEQTPLTAGVVVDVASAGLKLRLREHAALALALLAATVSVCAEVLAVHAGLTADVVWAPSDPRRAVALFVAAAPWAAPVVVAATRRRRLCVAHEGAAP